MNVRLGAMVNTDMLKSSGKLKPTTFWFSTAEKPFSVSQAMYFFLFVLFIKA